MTPMVTRMGHIALRVPDLDASVAFQQDVLGMVETERSAGVSYLTCNERHHELMLIQDPVRRGYDHVALEVADAAALAAVMRSAEVAGGRSSATSTTASRASTARCACSRPAVTSSSSSAAWRRSPLPNRATVPRSSSTRP